MPEEQKVENQSLNHFGQTGKQTSKKNLSSQKKKKNFTKRGSKTNYKPVVPRVIVFTYTSDCCKVPARKPALLPKKGEESKEPQGLGKWRCSSCSKRCKVTVSKAS